MILHIPKVEQFRHQEYGSVCIGTQRRSCFSERLSTAWLAELSLSKHSRNAERGLRVEEGRGRSARFYDISIIVGRIFAFPLIGDVIPGMDACQTSSCNSLSCRPQDAPRLATNRHHSVATYDGPKQGLVIQSVVLRCQYLIYEYVVEDMVAFSRADGSTCAARPRGHGYGYTKGVRLLNVW